MSGNLTDQPIAPDPTNRLSDLKVRLEDRPEALLMELNFRRLRCLDKMMVVADTPYAYPPGYLSQLNELYSSLSDMSCDMESEIYKRSEARKKAQKENEARENQEA